VVAIDVASEGPETPRSVISRVPIVDSNQVSQARSLPLSSGFDWVRSRRAGRPECGGSIAWTRLRWAE
jgi:hypothetical protein